MRPRPRLPADVVAVVLLTAAWCLPALWIGLHGHFCLYDDWAYAETVKHWLETGQFARPRYIFAPTLSNAAIGLAFTSIFGFSFTVLRASTFVVGWLGILVTYGLCRQLKAAPGAAGLAAAALAVNPLYFLLSYSFMTDVAFTTFVAAGMAAFARATDRRSAPWMAVAVLMALAAVLSRSPGIALPVAMALAFLAARIREPRTWILVAAGLAATAGFYWFGPRLLFAAQDAGSNVSFSWYLHQNLVRRDLLYDLARNGLTAIYLLGVFLAPLVLARRLPAVRGRWVVVGGAAAAAVVLVFLVHQPAPYSINLIRDLGLGPISIKGGSQLPKAPPGLWLLIAALGFACSAAAVLCVGDAVARRGLGSLMQPGTLALALFPVLYLLPLSIQWPFLDRWLLPTIPLLLALLARFAPAGLGGWRLARGVAWLAVLGCFSILGTRDQLTYHRALADLTTRVLAMGYPAREINAGTGFNGWYHWNDPGLKGNDPRSGQLWVVDNRVVVTLRPHMPGYRPLATARYRNLMGPAEVTITAFLREDPETQLRPPAPGPGAEAVPRPAGPSPFSPSLPVEASFPWGR